MKQMTYNRIRAISLVVCSVAFVFCILQSLFFVDSDSWILLIGYILAMLAYAALMTFSAAYLSRHKCTDEMSEIHEGEAYKVSFNMTLILLMVGVMAFVFFDPKIEITSSLFFGITFFMMAARDAWYLFLEKKGLRNANLDD